MFDIELPFGLKRENLTREALAAWIDRIQVRRIVGLVLLACLLLGLLTTSLLSHHSKVVTSPHAGRSTPTTDLPAVTTGSTDQVGSGGSGANGDVVVQIGGAVAHPGVLQVASTARINDVVSLAGGFSADADRDNVNLAGKVSDGQYIYIPRVGQTSLPTASSQSSPAAATSGATPNTPVDINTASEQELESLPGVGPSTANAILAYRTQHGLFHSVDDLGKIKGIGPAKLEQMRGSARV